MMDVLLISITAGTAWTLGGLYAERQWRRVRADQAEIIRKQLDLLVEKQEIIDWLPVETLNQYALRRRS